VTIGHAYRQYATRHLSGAGFVFELPHQRPAFELKTQMPFEYMARVGDCTEAGVGPV